MLLSEVPEGDMSQLFSHTIQFHKSLGWLYIKEVNGISCSTRSCDGRRVSTLCTLTDDEWEIRAPSLGFINSDGGVAYVARNPKRIMKAGVSFEAVSIDQIPNRFRNLPQDIPGDVILQRCDLRDMFNNVYPSLQDAISRFDGCTTAVAYDRQFALYYTGKVLYRGSTIVGACDFETREITYLPKYRFLEFAGVDYGKNLQVAKQAARQRVGRAGD